MLYVNNSHTHHSICQSPFDGSITLNILAKGTLDQQDNQLWFCYFYNQWICTCLSCRQIPGYCNGMVGYFCFHGKNACGTHKNFAKSHQDWYIPSLLPQLWYTSWWWMAFQKEVAHASWSLWCNVSSERWGIFWQPRKSNTYDLALSFSGMITNSLSPTNVNPPGEMYRYKWEREQWQMFSNSRNCHSCHHQINLYQIVQRMKTLQRSPWKIKSTLDSLPVKAVMHWFVGVRAKSWGIVSEA